MNPLLLGPLFDLGGKIIATVHADDGTDFQSLTQEVLFSAVNKAGTVTAVIQAAPTTSLEAASTGTLTATWTIVASGSSVLLQCNAVSSLTQTTLKCSYQLVLQGDGLNTITP